MVATSEHVILRLLEKKDAERLFGWRNDPFIANLGSLQRKVTWEEHLNWVTETIKEDRRIAYIIHIDGLPAGQVRFDFDESDVACCTISIYLIKEFLGKGFGVSAIVKSCKEIFEKFPRIHRILAHVRKDNEKGAQGFLRAAFIEYSKEIIEGHWTFACYNSMEREVPHNKLTFDQREVENVSRVVASGYWAGGKEVAMLEKTMASICNKKYAVGVGSGLAALRLSLLALGAKKEKHVLIPAYACVALPNAVLATGASPVVVDITLPDFTISAEGINQLNNENSVAIIAVNTFGYPAEFGGLKKTRIPVIEDCSHGFGNGYVGNNGDITIVSFYATKFIGGGEGGVIMTDREDIFEAVRDLRDYTDKEPSAFRLNDKLSDIHASVICAQLEKLKGLIQRRKALAQKYLNRLSLLIDKFPGLDLPADNDNRIWYRFALSFNDPNLRSHVIKALTEKKITVCSPMENWMGSKIDKYSEAKKAYDQVVSIPLYPALSDDDQQYILNEIERSLITFYNG